MKKKKKKNQTNKQITTSSAKTKQKDKKLLFEKCNKMFIEGLAASGTFLYKVKAVVGLAILHDSFVPNPIKCLMPKMPTKQVVTHFNCLNLRLTLI